MFAIWLFPPFFHHRILNLSHTQKGCSSKRRRGKKRPRNHPYKADTICPPLAVRFIAVTSTLKKQIKIKLRHPLSYHQVCLFPFHPRLHNKIDTTTLPHLILFRRALGYKRAIIRRINTPFPLLQTTQHHSSTVILQTTTVPAATWLRATHTLFKRNLRSRQWINIYSRHTAISN